MKQRLVDYDKLTGELFETKMEIQVFDCGQDEQEEAKSTRPDGSTKSSCSESIEEWQEEVVEGRKNWDLENVFE